MVRKVIFNLFLLLNMNVYSQNFMFNQHNVDVLKDTLIWSITSNNPCSATPWEFTKYGYFDSGVQYDIMYRIEDSENCGGTCTAIQSGEAIATIYTTVEKELRLTFEGIGEKESSSFEKIKFYFNGTLVAEGHAPGGKLECEMGEIVTVNHTTFPIIIPANTITKFRVDFSTVDALYHVDAYYYIFFQLSNKL